MNHFNRKFLKSSILFFTILLFSIINVNGAFFQKDTSIQIIQLPINYSKERIKLSIEYLKIRHGITQTSPTITPIIIVLHYTDGGTIKSIHNYFNSATIEDSRSLNKKVSALNVGSQFLIDRDGKIYQLMPDNFLARHAIGINYCAIGVENIGGDNNPLTQAQVIANAKLVRHLSKKYKIEYLVGHSEYTVFKNTPIWKETDPKYITYKSDPGKKFMEGVRALTKDLGLKAKP
jgi:N-acetyl-anhydromuramyl-L-alanine amidase AmpD